MLQSAMLVHLTSMFGDWIILVQHTCSQYHGYWCPGLLASSWYQHPWYWLYTKVNSCLTTCVKSVWRNDINCRFHFYISYEKNSMQRVKDVPGSLRSSTVIIKPDNVKSNCFRNCGYRNGESSPAETLLNIAKIARLGPQKVETG